MFIHKTIFLFHDPSLVCVPFEGVLALRPEEVNVGLELQLEDVLLVDAVRLLRGADRVAEQGQAGQREVVLQEGDGGGEGGGC